MARDSAPAQNAPLKPTPQRSPSSSETVTNTDQGTPASTFGLLADNAGFVAKLGANGWSLGAEFLSGEQVSLEGLVQPISGVHLDTARWRSPNLQLRGHLSIPYLDNAEFEASINAQGSAKISGKATKQLALPALGNPEITLSMTETGALSGEINAQNIALVPKSLADQAKVIADGTIRLTDGRLSGDCTAQIFYSDLGKGDISFNFSDSGSFSASGTLKITPPFVEEVTGAIGMDEVGNLSASASMVVGSMQSTLPGLSLTGGSLKVDYMNGVPSGAIEDFSAAYPGLGSVTIEQATISARGFAGRGSLNLEVPGLKEASGKINISRGRVSGAVKLGAEAFPEGLPVQQPNITASLAETGSVSVAGSAKVQLGPAGTGTLAAGYSAAEGFSLGGDVQLSIPGLDTVTAHISYAREQVSGEVQMPVDSALLPGLDGAVTVRYEQDKWSGETTLNFSADNGKLSGAVTVTVAQTDEGALQLGGEGEVTAQLMPRLEGTLTASILPEGGVDVSGAIAVTEPLELFPEKRMDKELFKYSQNIPLWAMLVAVVRVRAGVRSGVGPGVFRNIRVEGSYTLGADESDPSFNVSGELYVPAFVEGYVAFGAGLGLDVVLGSLTGGIEGVGTAGLYGAISAVPELNYADGDWGIEGTATLAAGARLKLGLNAWAEIEALWVTVWDKEWNLAEVVMPAGPDLALQAHMAYKFGQPEPPQIEMRSSDIDTKRLIQDAMPKNGPAPSGAREALENKAQWKGKLREQRQAAVPAEQVAQQNEAATPPPAPARPPKPSRPPSRASAADDGRAASTSAEAVPERSPQVDEAAKPNSTIPATVPEGSLPESDQPRHPKSINLAMLDEPAIPLPRTPSQEKQDIDAADEMVGLVDREAHNPRELGEYFPRIKKRFGLVSLGFEGGVDKKLQVVGKVNPQFKRDVKKPSYKTNIQHPSTGTLGGSTVGLKMVAEPLGPDHPQGTGTNNSLQKELMEKLPTNKSVYPKDEARYIRGHLLNDNLGGKGEDKNLFPITAAANREHDLLIERLVKNWVNVRKLWISYTVEVESDGLKPFPDKKQDSPESTVDSKLKITAAALDTNLEKIPKLTESPSINSRYQPVGVARISKPLKVNKFDEAIINAYAPKVRSEDKDLAPKLSTRIKPTSIPDEIIDTITELGSKRNKKLLEIGERLKKFKGFAQESERVLLTVYAEVVRTGDTTVDFLTSPSDRGTLTRIINTWGGDKGLKAWLLASEW